jgi:hypothetical protein
VRGAERKEERGGEKKAGGEQREGGEESWPFKKNMRVKNMMIHKKFEKKKKIDLF